jgi:predicted Zn finger-like uncharacterized protein
MIIDCPNCNKKFEINSEQIPENGRRLVCGSCNNEWFFKKVIKIGKPTKVIQNKKIENKSITDKIIEKKIDEIKPSDLEDEVKKDDKQFIKKNSHKNKINIFNIFLILIISAISLIILVDTFKSPISVYIPNTELILQNLYETIIDLRLFFKDLF